MTSNTDTVVPNIINLYLDDLKYSYMSFAIEV